MQQLETVQNPGHTVKSNKVTRKSKVSNNSKKTEKSGPQFAEIFGQISSSIQAANKNDVRQPRALQPETTGDRGKTVKTGGVGIKSIDPGGQSTKGKTEARFVPNIQSQQNEKAAALLSVRGTIVHPETNRPINSPRIIENHSTNKPSGTEKAAPGSNSAKKPSEATSGNFLTSASKPTAPSENKIADLVLAGNMSSLKTNNRRTADNDLPSKGAAAASSMSSAHTGSELKVTKQDNTKNGDKEAGSDTASAKTGNPKAEITQNALTVENGAVQLKAAESTGINAERPILDKSQADLLVSKMIQQIKVAPSSLEVSLKPEYLGKVNILVHSVGGVISVNVIAQNSEALHLLNSNLPSIKDSLDQQGINVQQLEVSLANQEKQDNQSGSRYNGESRAVQLSENADASSEHSGFAELGQNSLSPYGLNLLA